MPTLFFQKYWEIVGGDIIDVVINFLNNENFIDDINQTFIILIPKVQNPKNMMQFRSLSLCNVIYKIISKFLANKLKVILPQSY